MLPLQAESPGLSDLANKNSSCPVKSEFETPNEYFLSVCLQYRMGLSYTKKRISNLKFKFNWALSDNQDLRGRGLCSGAAVTLGAEVVTLNGENPEEAIGRHWERRRDVE